MSRCALICALFCALETGPAKSNTYVDFVRDGIVGNGAARTGDPRWRRLTEIRVRAAKSVFRFDVQGQVAKSTHAGLPWLLHLRRHLGRQVHFWPSDGWQIPPGRSAVVEVYPLNGRTTDQHDAYSVAAWLRQTDLDGRLQGFLSPSLTPSERRVAEVEVWILGVA